MKSYKIKYLLLIVFVLSVFTGWTQDIRTSKTKVADALAQLPAKDKQQADHVFQELISLDSEGLSMLTDQVFPNGMEEGVAPRFAVSLLTHHQATKEQKVIIESAYLSALSKADNNEVKAYFMANLRVIGSDQSVKSLGSYLSNKDLFEPAVSALVSIGTVQAEQSLMNAISASTFAKARLVKSMGELKYMPSLQLITGYSSDNDLEVRKQALWSIALLADGASYDVLFQQAKNVGFKNDPSEATHALVEFMHQTKAKGNGELGLKISKDILTSTTDASQQHFRLAALQNLAAINPGEALKSLLTEYNRFDSEYQREILNVAQISASEVSALSAWTKEYKKATGDRQADILYMLARANTNDGFIASTLLPALTSKNKSVRVVAASDIARSRNKKYATQLVDYVYKITDDSELPSAKEALLQLIDKDNSGLLAQKLETAKPKNRIIMIEVLAEKRAQTYFEVVARQTSSQDADVRLAAFKALPNLSSGSKISALLTLLSTNNNEGEIKSIQSAIVAGMDDNSVSLINDAFQKDKIKILPLLPYIKDTGALDKVISSFNSDNEKEKETAFEALLSWQNSDAARTLLSIRKDGNLSKYHDKAFNAYVSQVTKSSLPDDQKLLMLEEIMKLAKTTREKSSVLRAAGNVRTFLSLMFVSNYIDDADLGSVASRSVFQIALPTSDGKPGMEGNEVRNILQRMLDKLNGGDSQYEQIDIITYLKNMPRTKGYESIFNGNDLTGWQGLVENPIARSKMTKEELAAKQLEADAKVKNNWSVKDGCIAFQGDGANLCTVRKYGDFEMLVDWKISKNGDSGIYLRGSPQVQIWDIARIDVGAQVGSGGLYNNKNARSTPLVVADNPIGEWNTFRIKMVGDKVTVHLNGVLVVDNVTLENYWDRNIPIFPEEAIELQAHGTDLAFRNIYVKELSSKPYELTSAEKQEGFELLFNGKDLNNWQGNKIDYMVEDNAIAIYPTKEGHGNLYTEKEYSDFIFRFEFQLTPGANNGLGIHAPLEGDAAYVGKEIQILDNEAPIYSKLEQYQYHGSVYGVIPAKRGYLKPVGEWNQEEVYVKGDYIKVTLNGTVILEGDMKKASKKGTMDHKQHSGLEKHKGYIGFLGHGSVVKFRAIRIKELTK